MEAVLAKGNARVRKRLEGDSERRLIELQVVHVVASFLNQIVYTDEAGRVGNLRSVPIGRELAA